MMNKKILTISIVAATLMVGCNNRNGKADDPLAESGRTQRTENLLENLKAQGDSGVYMFGQESFAALYGAWQHLTMKEQHNQKIILY